MGVCLSIGCLNEVRRHGSSFDSAMPKPIINQRLFLSRGRARYEKKLEELLAASLPLVRGLVYCNQSPGRGGGTGLRRLYKRGGPVPVAARGGNALSAHGRVRAVLYRLWAERLGI